MWDVHWCEFSLTYSDYQEPRKLHFRISFLDTVLLEVIALCRAAAFQSLRSGNCRAELRVLRDKLNFLSLFNNQARVLYFDWTVLQDQSPIHSLHFNIYGLDRAAAFRRCGYGGKQCYGAELLCERTNDGLDAVYGEGKCVKCLKWWNPCHLNARVTSEANVPLV